MLAAALAVAVITAAPAPAAAGQLATDAVGVGVRYEPNPDPARRRTDLENMRRLRFTIVVLGKDTGAATRELTAIDRLLAGDLRAAAVPAAELGVVPVSSRLAPESVREAAWTQLGFGKRAVIFDDWQALQENEGALAEAAAFAESLARNPALYAPLRPARAAGTRAFTIEGGQNTVEANWLESDDALMLIAVNHAAEPREVTLTFNLAVPEAIWQNMLTGGAVNFVAGPNGPFYQRTFGPRDVLVLMIRKRLK
jgi:hypothetical protein